jgi:zinc transport system substrate-binding protein
MKNAKLFVSIAIFIAVVVALILFLWQQRREVKVTDKPLVVATVPHVAVWLENIVGEEAQIELLVKEQVDVHEFTFTPQDSELLAQADVIVANGAGLEPWLANVREQLPNVPLIETADGLDLIEDDPHTWLDPVQAQQQVTNAANGISATLPTLAETIDVNLQIYLVTLQKLDADIRAQLATVSQRKFIAFHESFGYFARSYELEQVAQLVERPGAESTLENVAEIGDLIERNKIKTIFIEPGAIPDLAATLRDEFDVELRILDTLETIVPERDAYLTRMYDNLEQLVSGL